MIELLSKYPILGTIIGIMLGFILTQIGVSYRARLENRRTLKTVLFHLLETYHSLDRSNPGLRLTKLTRKVIGMMPGQPLDEKNISQYEQLFATHLTSLAANHMAHEIQDISKDYQKSVQALSAIDPFTAYYLSRRTSIDQLFQSFSGFADQITFQSPSERAQLRQGVELFIASLKPKIFEDSLRDLEVDIRTIAFKISIFTWIRVQIAIARIKANVEKGMEKDFERFVKELMPNIEEAICAVQFAMQQQQVVSGPVSDEESV